MRTLHPPLTIYYLDLYETVFWHSLLQTNFVTKLMLFH